MPLDNIWDTLMRQAPATAGLYLSETVRSIDNTFGEGYAKTHPELVAAMIQTCARDFHSAVYQHTMGDVAAAIGRLADATERGR